MASKATIRVALMLLGMLSQGSLEAPARDDNLAVESLGPANPLIRGGQDSFSFSHSGLGKPQITITRVYDVATLLSSPAYIPSSTSTTPPNAGPLFSFSYLQSHTLPQTASASYVKTVTVTEEVPTTITLSANPVTVTEIFFPLPPMPISNSPSQTSTAGLGPAKSIWLAPTDLSDLSTFHVSKFTGGKGNLEFVNNVPAKAKRPDELTTSDDRDKNTLPPSTLLQLLFPAGSINPGTKPQGGAEFYASPINITSARNVTLRYSVFIPLGFDFVLGGKMPGLYGGHTGCSGGDPAVDCFSTRLMWREGGVGELYLYAPKERQSDKLCKAEGSVCDEMYGFSIGRGSFSWKVGDWTRVTQTVSLNTPGKQDGVFTLDVDGKRTISRNDILYRDDLREAQKGKSKGEAVKQKATTKHAKTKPKTAQPTSPSADGRFLGLGPLLSSLLGGLRRSVDPAAKGHDGRTASPTPMTIVDAADASSPSPGLVLRIPLPTHLPVPSSQDAFSRADFEIESATLPDVTFVGIFFSTFFGGHDDKYATPRDQYVWFKDFGLAYNS